MISASPISPVKSLRPCIASYSVCQTWVAIYGQDTSLSALFPVIIYVADGLHLWKSPAASRSLFTKLITLVIKAVLEENNKQFLLHAIHPVPY